MCVQMDATEYATTMSTVMKAAFNEDNGKNNCEADVSVAVEFLRCLTVLPEGVLQSDVRMRVMSLLMRIDTQPQIVLELKRIKEMRDQFSLVDDDILSLISQVHQRYCKS